MNGSLVKSYQDNDRARMKAELNILSNASQVVQGELVLVETIAYDTDFNQLATSDANLGASVTDDAAVMDYLKTRDKADARKPVTYMWATPTGKPVFSTIVPVGGFRAVGFMEVITDPLPTLTGIGKVLGGNFRILGSDGNVLFESLEDGEASEGGEVLAPTADSEDPAPAEAKSAMTVVGSGPPPRLIAILPTSIPRPTIFERSRSKFWSPSFWLAGSLAGYCFEPRYFAICAPLPGQ